jgi:DNA polymerase-4
VRGIDDREVQPHRETKSVGAEDTFPYDLKEPDEMHEALDRIAKIVFDRLQRHGLNGRTLTLKIKYHDFQRVTRSHSFPEAINDLKTIQDLSKRLLEMTDLEEKRIRLLGISISNFHEGKLKKDEQSDQLSLEL